MPHSRQRRYASATGTRTTSTTRSTLLTPAEEDQCVKRRRGTSTAARSRTQTLKKYRRQNIGDIPSLTNEMSTGPKVNGSTNINSQDEIGQSDVSVNSLLKCVSGAMKTLHDHVLNANTLRPPCDNHVTLPDLSILPKDVLSQQLQPVVTLLKKLRIEAVLPSLQPVEETIEETVNNDHTIASVKASLGDGRRVYPIHELIQPPNPINVVRYLHICEDPELFSLGIFVFPPLSKIPLHNHPGMCVISRILYGDLTLSSYDWLLCCGDTGAECCKCCPDNQQLAPLDGGSIEASSVVDVPDGPTSRRTFRKSWFIRAAELLRGYTSTGSSRAATNPNPTSVKESPKKTFLARKVPSRVLKAPDISILFPYEGNVHEFVAGPNGAAVLDILLPPYDVEHDRDCTFFVPEKLSSGDDLFNLRPISQPTDFHCFSGVFGEVGIADD